MKNKILITGVAGFVGSHLSDRLVELDYEVIGVDDFSRGDIKNVNPWVTFYIADIRHRQVLKKIFETHKPDYVFHFAALARVRPSVEDPIGYNSVNVDGTLNVLEMCVRYGSKLIFSSSSSIFGTSSTPWREDAEKNPANPYALQKLIAEQYIKLYGELYGLKYTILRFFNVYGPRQIIGGAYATVIGIFLDQKKRGEPLTLIGDGKQKRDMTHIRDLLEALLKSMDKQGEFNVGRGNNISVQEIADMISDNQTYLPEVKGELRETLCDNTKAHEEFGWVPRLDVTPKIIKEMEDYEN